MKMTIPKSLFLLLSLFILVFSSPDGLTLAAPTVYNNTGIWLDSYNDILGISSSNAVQHNSAAGIIELAPNQSSGTFTTVLIEPTSFDAWGELTFDGNYSSFSDIQLSVLEENGSAIAGYQNLTLSGGAIDLSGLSATTYALIRIQVDLNQSGAVAPVVSSLQATWHPTSHLLLDKQAPPQSPAGAPFTYRIRYSVSFVEADSLIIWDTLPHTHDGAVNYPTDYGQDDNPTFVSATTGGQYWAGPGTLDVRGDGSLLIPANSVYWDLGTLSEGTTDSVEVSIKSPNGTLHGTTYSNTAQAGALNADDASSNSKATTITSAPAPRIEKQVTDPDPATPTTARMDDKKWYASPGGSVRYVVSDPLGSADSNDYAPEGRETMYNTVIYDDVSDLLAAPTKIDTAVGDNGFFNITGGGVFSATYTAPDGSGPLPAIVWDNVNSGVFAPGALFLETFDVTLLAPAPADSFDNTVCIDSDQTEPVCDTVEIVTKIDFTIPGIYAKGDDFDNIYTGEVSFGRNDDENLFAKYGDTFKYLHVVDNWTPFNINEVVIFDKVPSNTTFASASLPAAANGTVFYTTTLAYSDPTSPPPVLTSTMSVGNLGSGWLDLDSNPPADPSQVTWVAYYVPQISSRPFDAANPIDFLGYAELDVTIPDPGLPESCSGDMIDNYGLFYVYGASIPGDAVQSPTGGSPHISPPDPELTVIRPEVATFNVKTSQASITPTVVDAPGEVVYRLNVENLDTRTSDMATDVKVELQWSQLPVNGIAQYMSFVNVSGGVLETFDPTNGRLVLNLGTLAPGDSQDVELTVAVPIGVLDGEPFDVQATITGTDDVCSDTSASLTTSGTVRAEPSLQVVKNDVLDVIPGGSELGYTLRFNNIGTSPSQGTWVVDHVPNRMVFVHATGPNGEQVYVSDALPPDLPAALDVSDHVDGARIATHFTPATLNDGGTPNDPSDDTWTSPFGEATTWIAWQVDDQSLSPAQFPVGETREVGFQVRNDEDNGAAQVDSSSGTLIFNEAAMVSEELLPAIGNEVITTIEEIPFLVVDQTGPAGGIVSVGGSFAWTIDYQNTSGSASTVVVIQDTLPANVSFVSASHTWNSEATANGAPPAVSVPTTTTSNPDGTTTLFFDMTGYRGGDLLSLEGGQLTIQVTADGGAFTGEFFTNKICGEAINNKGSITVCDEDTVEVRNADLWLRKQVNNRTPRSGDTLTYILILSNEGQLAAQDVVLTDVLDPGLTYVSNSTQVWTTGYSIGEPNVAGQTLTWSAAFGNETSPAGAGIVPATSGDIYIVFEATVDGSVVPGTTLNNNANVTTTTAEEPTYPNDDDAEVRTPFPNPTITKSAPALANPGSSVQWTLSYRNLNNEDAQDVYIIDVLPDMDSDGTVDVTFLFTSADGPAPVTIWYHNALVTATPAFDPADPAATGWTAAPGASVTHIAYDVGALAALAGPYEILVNVRLTDPDRGSDLPSGSILTNNTEIFSSTVDEDTTNNTDDATVRTPGLELGLIKTGSIEGAFPGTSPSSSLLYTVDYENLGTTNAYGIRIVDTLPSEVSADSPLDNFTTVLLTDSSGNPVYPVDSAGTAITTPIPVTRVEVAGEYTWYLGLGPGDEAQALHYRKVGLPVGARGSFELFVTINDDVADGALISNQAQVISDRIDDSAPAEEYLENNVDDTDVAVYRTDLYINKQVVDQTGDERFTEPGHLLTYTLEYGNIGNIAAEDAVINEIIPDGTSYVPNSLVLPPDSTVVFFPNEAEAERFEIHFGAPLPAPSTYFNQSNLNDWLSVSDIQSIVTPTLTFHNRSSLDDTNTHLGYTDFDADGDGDLDLAVAVQGQNVLYLNDGTGNFTRASSGSFESNTTATVFKVVAFDADGDGDLDLAVANDNAVNDLFLNDGLGTFTRTEAGDFDDSALAASNMDIFDVNLDGFTDVVVGNLGQANQVFVNDGHGSFTLIDVGEFDDPTFNTNFVEVVDINGDGYTDLIDGTNLSDYIYLNDENGSFSEATVYGSLQYYNDDNYDLALFDVDGDTDIDIVGANSNTGSIVQLNQASDPYCLALDALNFSSRDEFDANGDLLPQMITSFDADGDGDLDVAIANSGSTAPNELYLNQTIEGSAGEFIPWDAGSAGTGVAFSDYTVNTYAITAFDADGDGDFDVALGNYKESNELYFNDGTGVFSGTQTFNQTTKTQTEALIAFDADNDTDIDIVVGNNSTTQPNELHLNDGSGNFTGADEFNANGNLSTQSFAAFDADGDGDLDLAVGNFYDPNELYLNQTSEGSPRVFLPWDDSSGGKGIAFNANGDRATKKMIAFDADGDGDTDVAVANSNNQGHELYLNDGSAVFTPWNGSDGLFLDTDTSHIFIAGDQASIIDIIDVDEDGDIDLVTGNQYRNQLFFNDGNGIFTPWNDAEGFAFDNYITTGNHALHAFDADNDGDADMAVGTAFGLSELFLNQEDATQTGRVTSPLIEPTTLYPNGGVLESWTYLLVDETLPEQTMITYDILDSSGTGIIDYTELRPDDTGRLNLAGLDVGTHPAIYLQANLSANAQFSTPELCQWVTIFQMSEGTSFTFQVQVDEPLQDQLQIDNIATIGSSTPELNEDNNQDDDTIYLRTADVEVVKSVDQAAALEGQSLLYTLEYRNNGPQPAENVVIVDSLPLSVTYAANSATPNESSLTGISDDPYQLTWNLGDLAVGDSGTITIPMTIQAGTAGRTLFNPATIETDSLETDETNNNDDATTYVGFLTNLYIEKERPSGIVLGDVMSYTLSYGNNGNADANDVEIQDVLPAGVTFVSANPTPSNVAAQTLTWDNIGGSPWTLVSGGTGSITVVVQVNNDPSLVNTALVNQAAISTSDEESRLSDNQDDHETQVTLQPAALSGYVWHDMNEDVLFDASEPGIQDVLITLTGTDIFGVSLLITDTTDSDGFYSFTNLNPGSYTVTESQPTPYTSTGLSVGTIDGTPVGSVGGVNELNTITLQAGDLALNYNLGEDFGVSLGNRVWLDSNYDGYQDDEASEPGIANVLVYLYQDTNHDGAFDGGDSYLAFDVTNADGLYRFDNLDPDDYIVLVADSNFTSSGPLANLTNSPGSNDPDDNNNTDDNGLPFGNGVVSQAVSIQVDDEPTDDGDTDHDSNLTLDFGFRPSIVPAALGNYVWLDENSDGYQDVGEPGIPNVFVNMTTSSGLVYTTTTDAHGGYLFDYLAAGTYTVTLPALNFATDGALEALAQTTNPVLAGADFGNQSLPYVITLAEGEENLTGDFGYIWNSLDVNNNQNNAALGDRIWVDSDGDGVQDINEIGVSGAEVTLYHDPDGNGVYDTPYTVGGYTPTTTTDENGNYIFSDLPPDVYVVGVTDSGTASHYVLNTTDYAQIGDPDHFGTDSSNAPTGTAGDNLSSQPVALASGDVFLNLDFDYQPTGATLGSIGDTVFFDADADYDGPSLPRDDWPLGKRALHRSIKMYKWI